MSSDRREFLQQAAVVTAGLGASAFPLTAQQRASTMPTARASALMAAFGLRYPILCAGMGTGATPELAIAVSNGGGLGAVGTGPVGRRSADVLRQRVSRTKSGTDRPFAVNYVLAFDPATLPAALDAGAPIIQFAWGIPPPETVAAILVEPITGLSGLVVPPDGYLQRLRDLCDRHGILLVFDEVITGFCRTGRWFGSQHWSVVPDLMSVAKGITSGYVPLGATLVADRVAAHFDDHYLGGGLTYAAHPLACAAGCAVMEVYLEEGLADRAEAMGRRLMAGLQELCARHPSVGEVRGRGLLACLELVKDRDTREPLSPQRTEEVLAPAMAAVRKTIQEKRAIPLWRWNLIVLAPPLTISEDDIDFGLDALDAGLAVADSAL